MSASPTSIDKYLITALHDEVKTCQTQAKVRGAQPNPIRDAKYWSGYHDAMQAIHQTLDQLLYPRLVKPPIGDTNTNNK